VAIGIPAVRNDIHLVTERRQSVRFSIGLASDSAEPSLRRILLGGEGYAHEFIADAMDCGAVCAWCNS
jgi:hypothetical protein